MIKSNVLLLAISSQTLKRKLLMICIYECLISIVFFTKGIITVIDFHYCFSFDGVAI
jgi:hypothetical protein